jgi:hypothetical protein
VLPGKDLREVPRLVGLARRVRRSMVVGVTALLALQAAILGVVTCHWLDGTFPGPLSPGNILATLPRWGYVIDALAFFCAVLPGALAWGVYSVSRRRAASGVQLFATGSRDETPGTTKGLPKP